MIIVHEFDLNVDYFLGELSVDFKTKIKTETDRQVAKDPWKETFFEDVWGFS